MLHINFKIGEQEYIDVVRDPLELAKQGSGSLKYGLSTYTKEALIFKSKLDTCGASDLIKAAFENRQFEERRSGNLNYTMEDFITEAFKFYCNSVLCIKRIQEPILETAR